jgi:hypothetical protein
MVATNEKNIQASITAAFGATNRSRLIDTYFAERSNEEIAPQQAWKHVYRLLLWVDQTTGLGHCYESDKSQPGKLWYARALAFHDWLSTALGIAPGDLAGHIDWLFLRAAADLADQAVRKAAGVVKNAELQRLPYEGRDFPRPSEDPELVAIIKETLGNHLETEPSPDEWRRLVQRIRQYLTLENKRRNLVGEGFEDVLAQVIRRTCVRDDLQVKTRCLLHDLPGFNRARAGDKPNKVDVSVVRPAMRTIITAKWSVRADREKQFTTDFADYINAESSRMPFEYIFVTNEFDPARLTRACDQLSGNARMFTHVVHISTDALKATYKQNTEKREADSMRCVLKHIEEGRLISLERWLDGLNSED